MKLIVNGEEREFKDNSTIENILQELKVRDKVMASAVNMEVVKEAEWKNFSPKEGDRVEFLQFVGGG